MAEISRTVDRKAWRREKACIVCGTTLGIALGKLTNLVSFDNLKNPLNLASAVPIAMSYHCKFCYHAVCADCSKFELMHPETQKLERACKNCYTDAVETRVRRSMSTDINRTLKELDRFTKAMGDEEASKQRDSGRAQALSLKLADLETEVGERERKLQAQLDNLNEQKQVKQKEIEFIRKQIRDFQAERGACITEVAILSQELQSINNAIAEDGLKLEQIQGMLDKQDKENLRLQKDFEGDSLDDSQDSMLTPGIQDDDSAYLQRLTNLQYEKLRLENEREKLQCSLKDSKVQIKIKESRISTLKTEITKVSATTQEELDELTDDPSALKEHLRLLEAENKDLKGREIVEQLQALKFLLEKQMTENTQLREKLGKKREFELQSQTQTASGSMVESGQCNCMCF